MRAMILAAGLGTRLRPLTDKTQKALVKVGGRPILEYSLDLFVQHGIREAVINVHHHADQMQAFVAKANRRWPLALRVQDESALLLGSGGGIATAREWLYEKDSAALFWNPDGLIFPDLTRMMAVHRAAAKIGDLATINVVRPTPGLKFGAVYCKNGRVLGFGRQADVEAARTAEALHFIGAYILEKEAAAMLPAPGSVCDVAKEVWFQVAKAGRYGAFIHEGIYQELGTPEDVAAGTSRLTAGEFSNCLPPKF